MIILRILFNGIIMAAELAAIFAVSWLGYRHPYLFAGLTALLGFLLGTRLEIARLRNELNFYFGRTVARASLGVALVAASEATVKAFVAGLVALLMFSGTDQTRLLYTAIVFGVVLYAGSAILRRLTISFAAVPSRWGFFRLAPPLGLLFSLGLSLLVMAKLLPQPSLTDIVTHAFAGNCERAKHRGENLNRRGKDHFEERRAAGVHRSGREKIHRGGAKMHDER